MLDHNTDEFQNGETDTIDIPLINKQEQEENTEDSPLKLEGKKKNSILYMKLWDVLLLILYIIAASLLGYLVWNFQILPDSWLYTLFGALVFLLLAFIILTVVKLPNWGIWIRRFVLTLLSAALAYGSAYVSTAYNALSVITTPETTSTVNVSIITKKDSSIRKLEDLNNLKVGIQNANDNENSSYVRKQLESKPETSNISYEEGMDYTALYQNLLNNDIDGLIITNSYLTLLKKNFEDIDDNIRIVEVYQKEKPVEISTSSKDIRYETFTVFISGIEDMGDPSEDRNSDVDMLLIVNPLANKVEMASFPRDSYMPNPALNYGNDKLTHTGNNGVENTVSAIEYLTGLDIDYYAKVNFASIIEIVDTIGGIDVDVEISFIEQDENRSFEEEDLIHLEAGMQHLNGKQALAYARHRKTEGYGDVGRTRAQQRIIQGIINKLISAEGITKINSLMKVAQKFIVTNMPMEQVTNFVSYELDRIKPWSINSFTIETYGEMLPTASMGASLPLSVQIMNKESVQKILDIYQQMSNSMKMADFSFDLDELERDKPQLPVISNILWAGMDTSSYQSQDTGSQNSSDNRSNSSSNQTNTTPQIPETDTGSGNQNNSSNSSNNGSSSSGNSGSDYDTSEKEDQSSGDSSISPPDYGDNVTPPAEQS